MNVALMGSVSSSLHCLEALIRAGVEVTGVWGLDESQATIVSDYECLRPIAERARLPYLSFVRVEEPGVETFLRAHPPDLLWVVGLSQMIPRRLIRTARHGGVGFHPTMLPRGRGRAPVAWTILRNERAAVSLFFLTDEPDAGDIIVQREVPVLPDDYSEDLIRRTNDVLEEVVADLGPIIRAGHLPRTPQDHTKATYYSRRTPADGLIQWSDPTDVVYRLVRAAGRPYPGAFTFGRGRKVIVWRAKPADGSMEGGATAAECGTVMAVDKDRGVLARTGDGGLWLTEAKLEDGRDAAAAGALAVGLRLTGHGREEPDE